MQLPAAEPVVVRDVLDLARLVDVLRSEARTRPVAVLTVDRGQTQPYVDARRLFSDLKGAIDVVTIPTDDLTHDLARRLTDERAGVYRGACRVYPLGSAWEQDPHLSKLRMARDAGEIERLPEALLRDAREAVAAASAAAARATQHATPPPARPGGAPLPAPPRVPGASPSALQRAAVSSPAPVLAPEEVRTATQARALADHLRDAARPRPAVVVTRATGTPAPFIEVAELRDELNGLAEVFEIETLEASWAFSAALPDGCQVYGGASRVYPVGVEWLDDPRVSPLRFAFGAADKVKVKGLLLSDALSMAGGSLTLGGGPEQPTEVEGVVQGTVGGSALVMLPGQGTGVIWPELVQPGLPVDALLAKGMRVRGLMSPNGRRIDVRAMRVDPAEALAAYAVGDTVLARVEAVTSAGCAVSLLPGVAVQVPLREMSEDAADPRTLVGVGEVVSVRVLGREPWSLSLLDALEPAEAVAAPSVLRGGPPWLSPPEPVQPPPPEPEEPEPTPVAAPAPDPTAEAALRRENDQLRALLAKADRRITSLENDLSRSRQSLREATRKKRRQASRPVADAMAFATDSEQLDHEVYLEWATKIPAGEKAKRPLRAHQYGPRFFDSLKKIEGVSREKLVEVVMHVLTGLDAELASRELHQLRTGSGGDDPTRTRSDGSTAWRVSIQVNTPSARRLHYWRRPDGTVELARVCLHDDLEI
ncbi:MAG: hypothetical protein QM713_08955 [Arachnia sp.]